MMERSTLDSSRLSSRPVARLWWPQRGFTLIELMVALGVLAVVMLIAIPSFNDMTLGSKLRSQANDLVAGAVLARSEAIKRNQPVSLCASSNGTSCTGTWSQGWIVINGATVIMKHAAAANGFLILSDQSSFTFQPTGVGATADSLTVCRATPSVGGQEREVTITATGRASVEPTYVGSCAEPE